MLLFFKSWREPVGTSLKTIAYSFETGSQPYIFEEIVNMTVTYHIGLPVVQLTHFHCQTKSNTICIKYIYYSRPICEDCNCVYVLMFTLTEFAYES